MNKFDRDFDRDYYRTRNLAAVWFVISALSGLGITGFIIWVIVKLLQFFGVV